MVVARVEWVVTVHLHISTHSVRIKGARRSDLPPRSRRVHMWGRTSLTGGDRMGPAVARRPPGDRPGPTSAGPERLISGAERR